MRNSPATLAKDDPDVSPTAKPLWACFYAEGKNPEAHGTANELFLIHDGSATVMKNGLHPGIFVQRFVDDLSEGYTGYGPHKGGLEDFDRHHDAMVDFTYDDLGEEIRFVRFVYSSSESTASLQSYIETKIRKTTGRFLETHQQFPTDDIHLSTLHRRVLRISAADSCSRSKAAGTEDALRTVRARSGRCGRKLL